MDINELLNKPIRRTNTESANSSGNIYSTNNRTDSGVDYTGFYSALSQATETSDPAIVDKYAKRGLRWNREQWQSGELDKELAQKQSFLSKVWGAAVQTVASEIAIGTVKGAFDLIDLIGSAVFKNDNDYQNPITQALEKAQESVKEWAPIYTDPNKTIDNGGLLDASWWASNFPSVASSITLMIPASGTVSGISALGKIAAGVSKAGKAAKVARGVSTMAAGEKVLTNFTRKSIRNVTGATRRLKRQEALSKTQRFLNSPATQKAAGMYIKTGMTAALQRAMENYQESRQTFDDVYAYSNDRLSTMSDEEYADFVNKNRGILEGVDVNDKAAVAKRIASHSADLTNQIDWLNVGFDVVQLLALRNMWKGMGSKLRPTADVKARSKQMAKFFGKAAEETEEISKFRKGLGRVKNWTSNTGHVIKAEASEGVEEAINYIAQQEGLHYSRFILGDEPYSAFDYRLEDYIKTPELHDAAFWGVMGGVVFQGLGNGFKRLESTIERKNKEKARKNDPNAATTQKAEEQLPWYRLDDLPEVKRMKTELEARGIDTQNFFEKAKQILAGTDIYSTDKDAKLTTQEEKDAAMSRLYDEYIQSVTLRAVHAGTIDMLKEFYKDDNVRKGLIENGIITEEESIGFMQRTSDRINQIEESYTREIVAANYAAGEIEGDTPAELLEMIAYQNVSNENIIKTLETAAEDNNRKIDALVDKYHDQIEQAYKNFSDPIMIMQGDIELALKAHKLGQLFAIKKQLLQDKSNSLSAQIALKNIDKQISELYNQLESPESSAYATMAALRYGYDNEGKVVRTNTPEYTAYVDRMIVNRKGQVPGRVQNIIGLGALVPEHARRALSDYEAEAYQKLLDHLRPSLNELRKISPELDEALQLKYGLASQIGDYKARLVRTVDDYREKIDEMFNSFDQARVNAINQSNKIIQDAYKKDKDATRQLIRAIYDGWVGDAESLVENLGLDISDDYRKIINDVIDAIKILDLTKAHNKSLIDRIENIFDMVDAEDAAREKNSSTSVETIVGSQNQQESTTSETPIETLSELPTPEEMANSSAQGQTAEPTASPAPVSPIDSILGTSTDDTTTAATTPQPIGDQVIPIIDANGNDVGNYVKQGNENEYIPVYANKEYAERLYNDSNLYEKDEDVAIIDGEYEVEEPIYTKAPNGEMVLIQKGKIHKKDMTSQQEGQEGEPGSEPGATIISAESQSATISSTGEPQPNTVVTPDVSPISSPATAPLYKSDLAAEADSAFMDAIRTATDKTAVPFDQIANKLLADAIEKGYDKSVAEEAINGSRAYNERLLAEVLSETLTPVQSSILELMPVRLSVFNNNGTINRQYASTVEGLIEAYAAETGLEQINGKYYINFEDFLRYVNTQMSNNNIARAIYWGLKEYLKASPTVTFTDNNEVNKEDFIANVEKDAETRHLEMLDKDSEQQIDIFSYSDYIVGDPDYQYLISQFQEARDRIEIGDNLSVTRGSFNGNPYIIFKDAQDRVVATIPVPTEVEVDEKTGDYTIENEGWITKVYYNNGKVYSPLHDVFYKILSSNDEESKKLRSFLYAAAFDKDTVVSPEFLAWYSNTSFVQGAIARHQLNENKLEESIEHLIKLWRYAKVTPNVAERTNNIILKRSLQDWFEKLYNSYTFAHTLYENPDALKVYVSNITGIDTVRAGEGAAELAAMLPVKDAIVGGLNPDEQKLCAADTKSVGNVKVSGVGTLPFPSVKPGNTFLMIRDNNGNPYFVHAMGASLGDIFIGKDIKEIKLALLNKISALIRSYNENPSQENYDKLKNFFLKTFSNTGNNKSLFFGVNVGIKEKENKFTVVAKNTADGVSQKTIISIEQGKQTGDTNVNLTSKILERLINSAKLNISFAYIDSDSMPGFPLEGLCKCTADGRFVISIDDVDESKEPHTWSYSSFNEFALTNNLIKVNTKPNNIGTSNFKTPSEIDRDVLSIKVRFAVKSSPVGENVTTSTDGAKPVTLDAVSVINDDNVEHKGEALLDNAQLPLTQEQINSLKNLHLLPKSIIFDSDFNNRAGYENINAEVNTKTGVVTVGTRWVNFWNDPNTRDIAIKKLIHEELHNKLSKNRGYVRNAKGIFNEFREYLESGNYNDKFDEWCSNHGVDRETAINALRQYLFSDKAEEEALEEFLVESLTNENLASFLNTIEAKDYKKEKVRNLLQKILKLLAEVFNWGVTEGSLYEKELYTLRAVLKPDVIAAQAEAENSQLDINFEEQQEGQQIEEQPITSTTVDEAEFPENSNDSSIDLDAIYGDDTPDDELQSSITEFAPDARERFVTENGVTYYISDANIRVPLTTERFQAMADSFVNNPYLIGAPYSQRERMYRYNNLWGNWADSWIRKGVRVKGYFDKTKQKYIVRSVTPIENWKQSSVTELSYTPEMQQIKDQAIANGTFMKAPNGNPTNLDERQWLQVRTKAFKNWFGDWLGVNKFNREAIDISKVDIEETSNPNEHEGNKTLKIYLKGQHEKGHFELVKDREFGQYSVHLKTDKSKLEKGDTKVLFEELSKAIPEGAIVSTWGSLSEDGVRALNNNIGRGMTKIGERNATLKSDGSKIKIPIYQKGEGVSKVVDDNGEPLVVYHRSPKQFNKFDFNKLGSTTDDSGIPSKDNKLGFFFTSERHLYDNYKNILGNNIYEVFLNIKNPQSYIPITMSTNEQDIPKIIKDTHNKYDGIKYVKYMDNEIDFDDEGRPFASGGRYEFVIFNPNQIKSATDNVGTYSTEDNDILQSSVTEMPIVLTNGTQTLSQFISTLPYESRSDFRTLAENSRVEVSCR